MGEQPRREQEFEMDLRPTGDLNFLFDKNKPSAFAEKISRAGYEVVRDITDVGGEKITEIKVPEGEHSFIFGFRQIDLSEKRWLHSSLDDVSKQDVESFNFDLRSPEFVKISQEFVSALNDAPSIGLEYLVFTLNNIIQRRVESKILYEEANSLSEMIREGQGACESKSLLAGSMLKNRFPGLRVEIVDGYYGKFSDKITLPFGHAWLRISDGHSCVLYDPMYGKTFQYVFDTMPDGNNPFSRYTVSAFPIAKLHESIRFSELGNGVRIVKSHDGGKEVVVEDKDTLTAQIGGQIPGQVKAKGGNLIFVNGNISCGPENIKNAPRLLYPLLFLEKVE